MKKRNLFLCTCLFVIIVNSCNISNRDYENYCDVCDFDTSMPDSLYKLGDFCEAIFLYNQEYNRCKNPKVALKLAKAQALSNKSDSAIYYIDLATMCDSSLYKLYQGEFYTLLGNSEYINLEKRQLDKFEKKNGEIPNPELAQALLRMGSKDQAYYSLMGIYPDSVNHYWKLKREINKKNLSDVEAIIQEFGWPKISYVGKLASGNFFSVLQHCGDPEIMRKFFPLFEEQVKENEAEAGDFVLYVDRIHRLENKKQIYGSQVSYDKEKNEYYLDLNLVENPDSLAERRKELGIQPIEEYLKHWGAEIRK